MRFKLCFGYFSNLNITKMWKNMYMLSCSLWKFPGITLCTSVLLKHFNIVVSDIVK